METPVVHPVTPAPVSTPLPKFVLPAVTVLVVVFLGIFTGWLLSKSSPGTTAGATAGQDTSLDANIIGSSNTQTYRDSATGTIEAGGLNGEGTHKLVRDGGPSQTVYLISSVIDLNDYVGKKVEIWGLTLDAVKASWLMDVGRLKVIE
jgi:hypothetical protein